MQTLTAEQFKKQYGDTGIAKFGQPTQSPTQSIGSQIAQGITQGIATSNPLDAFSATTAGVQKFGKGFQQTQEATKTGDFSLLGRGILNEVGGGFETVFSPVTNVLQTSAKLPGISNLLGLIKKGVIDPASDENSILTSKPVQDLMMKYPNADEVVGNLITIFGLLIGGNKAPEIKSALDNSVNSIKNILPEKPPGGGGSSVGEIGTIENRGVTKNLNSKQQLQNNIKATMPIPDKEVRIESLRNTYPESATGQGGVTRKGVLGKSTIEPTPQDIKRGTIANEYIGNEVDPVKQIANVNNGIRTESVKTDAFLDKNSSPANFADMRTYIESNNQPSLNITKDSTAFDSYSRANENALNTLYETMKKDANQTGNFDETTPGSNLRKARIAIDQQITRELGEETFGTPQWKGIKAAEVSVRNTLNRMSEDLLRYPGQLEQLNKYNEFVNTLKSKNPDVKISPEYDVQLKTKFGLKSTPESEINANALQGQHEKMSNLYDARDNLIDNYQRSVGKNKVQEAIKNSPIIKGGVNVIKKVIPFGIGSHL